MKPNRLFVVLSICLLAPGLASAQAEPQTQATTQTNANADDTVPLSLDEAIGRALENNLDIVVSRLDTQVQGQGVEAAEGVYTPFLSAGINNLDTRSPAQNQLVGAQVLTRTQTVYNFTWQQELGTGGNYNVQWQNLRSTTNSAFTGFNPLFDSAIFGQITQPLMQNLRFDPRKQRILVAQNNERISRGGFEQQVMDTVRDVALAYWNFVFSIRDLAVARQSLELAEELLRNNRIQVEVGTMAPIDVLEAEAEVAAREEAVILAEDAIRRFEDSLKTLINDPESENFWTVSYVPMDQPAVEDLQIDVDESIRTALARRPVLDQTRVDLDTRDYNVRYTRNQMMPQVDVVGSLAFNGIGGDRLIRGDFAGEPTAIIPGGYGDAIDQIFGGDFRDWSVGLNVSYPLGNSQAEALHAQAQVAARQARARVDASEVLIAQEVRQAARTVDTNRKRIDATRVARELAERRLEAEEKKFEVGMSTSFLIVQAQRDLAQAAANELRALIDYNQAIVVFERARGTILDRTNVSVR